MPKINKGPCFNTEVFAAEDGSLLIPVCKDMADRINGNAVYIVHAGGRSFFIGRVGIFRKMRVTMHQEMIMLPLTTKAIEILQDPDHEGVLRMPGTDRHPEITIVRTEHAINKMGIKDAANNRQGDPAGYA